MYGTPRSPGDGRPGYSADRATGHGADRTGNGTDACANSSAADTFLSRGAGRSSEAEKGDESELLHGKPPEKADGSTGPARGVRFPAGLHVTLFAGHGSGK
jgi:hypothetical protein